MYILFLYILFTFLYSNLHFPTFVASKHLLRNGFTLDLVHRYSPGSPFYDFAMTLRERSKLLTDRSFSRYRHLISLRNKTGELNPDLTQNNGDYLVKLSIGVPPVDVFLSADTGSDLIWVQCQPCNECYPQKLPLFDPKKSSTFRIVPCTSPVCRSTRDTRCNYSSNECQYRYSYGDGWTMTSGTIVTDVFTRTNTSLLFGCGFTQRGDDYDENEAGIVGLSGGPLSLITQMGSAIDNRFSYCLTPISSNVTSKLILGNQVDTKLENVQHVTAPLLSYYFPDFYAVNMRAISVGQTRVEVYRAIIVDNGSTLTYLAPSVYYRLEEAIKEAISVKPMANPTELDLKLCYDKKSGFRSPENIVIHLAGGDILLNTTNFMIDSGDNFVCLAIVPSDNDQELMILGNVAQVNFEIEFDLVTKMVSFTPASCGIGNDTWTFHINSRTA